MKRKRVSKAIVHQPAAQFYERFVEGIKQRIRAAQIKAAISANRELILLYWDIGRAIVDAQKDKGYGKRVVEMLSADLRREFPEMAGLSALNLWRMRAFYLAYAVSDQKLSQLVTESDSAPRRKLEQPVLEARVQPAQELHGQKLSQAATQSVRAAIELVASLPWGHNIVLMQKVKEVDARLWYARGARLVARRAHASDRNATTSSRGESEHQFRRRFTCAAAGSRTSDTEGSVHLRLPSRWTPAPGSATSSWACSITSKNSWWNLASASRSSAGNTRWKCPAKNFFSTSFFIICGCAASWWWI